MSTSFEDSYLKLRTIEHRVYPDEVVKNLPLLFDGQLLKIPSIVREWRVRARSTEKLIHYLRNRPPHSILELGCGNGWLSNRLAAAFSSGNVLATDINETELLQARRVFSGSHNLTFKLADGFDQALAEKKFDCIVLAGVIQYFPDLQQLFNALYRALAPDGEIHLMDSPIYNDTEISEAKRRSEEYFDRCGCPDMKIHYHHHSWQEFGTSTYRIQYNPLSFWNRLGQKIKQDSPFPWIVMR